MQEVATHLLEIIEKFLPVLEKISDEEASIKPLPNKWSKKELIGHLIDSACNNQQKIVRTINNPNLQMVGYMQDEWVYVQNYNKAKWGDLLSLWAFYNKHIAHVIANVNPLYLNHEVSIEGSSPFKLSFIMQDYPEHLKHHLKQILPDAIGLENTFNNVYGA
jgi:hypothetical protein